MSLFPRGILFRALWAGITAGVGYIYYQFHQASFWLEEKGELLREWGLASLLGIVDTWAVLKSASLAIEEGYASWNPFGRSKKKMSPTRREGGDLPAEGGRGSAEDGENDAIVSSSSPGLEADGGHGNFREFIKKMIEVRNILKSAEMDSTLSLPSIVVIGSQSSGKSSVLESIVGHEFLPKGQNMVTRRPLELTLVNSPHCARDYAEFGQLQTGPIYDFAQVQKTLTEMNLAVPENQWISPKPIELTIYSKNVPDLSLVDLPGYIQIHNRNQPAILRDKISQLCERYIRQDNIILAVCPADVDLANAEALKASRAVDPEGQRTIGVITKLDLVDPHYSAELIRNEDYPLRLGYIGVICKPPETCPQPRALAILGVGENAGSPGGRVYEEIYLQEHGSAFEVIRDRVGIGSLRKSLTLALEGSMSASLSSVLSSVQDELSEVKYALKVEYSDRVISPEGYVSLLATSVKNGLESVAKDFNRFKVREALYTVLRDRYLSIVEEFFWQEDPTTSTRPKPQASQEVFVRQAAANLTKSGVGRLTANSLVDVIMAQVKQVIKDGPLAHHPAAKERLLQQVDTAMRSRCQVAIDQIENAIKPLKSQLDFTDEDWRAARTRTLHLLKDTVKNLESSLQRIQSQVGAKRLCRVVAQLEEEQKNEVVSVGLNVNTSLVQKAKEAVALSYQLRRIRQRLSVLEATDCVLPADPSSPSTKSWFRLGLFGSAKDSSGRDQARNELIVIDAGSPEAKILHIWNECQTKCPEIYLYMVMDQLLSTAALHVHHELVDDFLNPFPEELAVALAPVGLERREIQEFVEENPLVARHLKLQERRKILERVRERLAYLQHLKQHNDHPANV